MLFQPIFFGATKSKPANNALRTNRKITTERRKREGEGEREKEIEKEKKKNVKNCRANLLNQIE